MVIQNIDPNQNLTRASSNNARTGSGQQLVNGMNAPTIQMRPNEVQLWRIVNATVGSFFLGLGMSGRVPDGRVSVPPDRHGRRPIQPERTTRISRFSRARCPTRGTPGTPGLMLSAGNRADVLVQAPATPGSGPVPFTSNGVTLFFVNVTDLCAGQTRRWVRVFLPMRNGRRCCGF